MTDKDKFTSACFFGGIAFLLIGMYRVHLIAGLIATGIALIFLAYASHKTPK